MTLCDAKSSPHCGGNNPRRDSDTSAANSPDLAAELRGRRSTRYLGFSLHADVRVSALARDRLEKLARYVCRGPICNARLELTGNGKVLYRFKRPWRDGTRAVVLTPLAFLERLSALVPRPRRPLLTYLGVLAPAAHLRPAIVPPPPNPRMPTPCTPRSSQVKRVPHYYTWAELLKRVLWIDALICDHCQGPRRVLTAITDPNVVHRILEHLGLPTQPPAVAPARSPPGCDDDYGA